MCSDIHFGDTRPHVQTEVAAVLNEEVTNITSNITALSDVSALISLDALAAAHFESDAVGVVNATYQLCPTGKCRRRCILGSIKHQ